MKFELHPRLAAGGFELGRLNGCRLLLKNNALFPWLIIVPEVENVDDLHELSLTKYHSVMLAIRNVSEFVSQHFRPNKLNVGCIGNQVRQLHIHIVGRISTDLAWPGTVWAFDGGKNYTEDEVANIRTATNAFFGSSLT